MAEQIVIAELQLNTQSLQDSSTKLIQEIAKLKAEQKDLVKETKGLTQATDEQSRQYIQTDARLKQLNAEYANNKKVLAEASSGVSGLNTLLSQEISRVGDAEQANKKLSIIRSQITTETQEGRDAIEEINAKIDENNDFINENSDSLKQQKINVGNYKESIIEAFQEMERTKIALTEQKEALQELQKEQTKGSEEWNYYNNQINQTTNQINVLNVQMGELNDEATASSTITKLLSGDLKGLSQDAEKVGGSGNLMKSTLKGASESMMGLVRSSVAFVATPVGAILAALVLVFALVKNAMNRSEESTAKITKVFSVFGGITNQLLKYLEPLGEFLIDGIVAGFELVGKAAETAINIVAGSLALLGFKDASKSVSEFGNDMSNSAKQAMELAEAELELDKAQRISRKTQLQYQDDAEKLRQIRGDESLTLAERTKANKDLGLVLKRQLEDELNLANAALKVANIRIEQEGKTKETLDAQEAALTEIVDIQERLAGQESEQLANLNSLRKEATDKEKERIADLKQKRQEAQDKFLENMNQELSLFVAKENLKSKTVEQSLIYEKEFSDKRLAILQKELEFGKKTQVQYQEELIKINQEYANKLSENILAQSKAELDLFVSENASKLDSAKLLTQALIDDEAVRLEAIKLDKLNLIEQEKKTNQTIIDEKRARNEELTVADIEYLTAKNNLEAEFRLQNKANQDAFDAQVKEQQAEQLLADREIELEAAQSIFEEDNIIAQQNYDIELEQLKAKLEKELITQEQYNKLEVQANDRKNALINLATLKQTQAQLGGLQALGGGMEALFGKSKALSLGMALINGAQAITSILAQYPKYDGGFAMTAALISAGATTIAQVSQIQSTKFERGGLQKIGGNRHSAGGTKFMGEDGTRFEAEEGELIGVMNRNAATAFMEFNNAFPSGSANTTSNYFESGGMFMQGSNAGNTGIDYDKLAMKLAQANSTLPPPIVYAAVTDINSGQENYAQVVNGANH